MDLFKAWAYYYSNVAYRLFRNISGWDVHIVRPDEGSKDKLYDRDMEKFHYLRIKKRK